VRHPASKSTPPARKAASIAAFKSFHDEFGGATFRQDPVPVWRLYHQGVRDETSQQFRIAPDRRKQKADVNQIEPWQTGIKSITLN
jgi:hypothetical protein